MKIILDEEKIAREGKYDIEKINEYLDIQYKKLNIHKDSEGFLVGGNFTTYASIATGFSKKDWFRENVKVWEWYDSDDGTDENDFAVEDLMEHYEIIS